MTDAVEVKPEDIWADDLLGRKDEALLLQGYLESVASPNSTANRGSFVLAVDAGYGEGKTFFLTRFARQLKQNHPVAYVDAWKDDLANDPLAAIVATLGDAFKPLLQDKNIKKKFEHFIQAAGRVGLAFAQGLARRALSVLVTEVGADVVSEALGSQTKLAGSGRKVFVGAVDDAAKSQKSSAHHLSLRDRVKCFREGQRAMDTLKGALSALVESLDGKSFHAPIFVIIDELDRCRPTYAIELLEAVKHLFDVRGLAFILGMNGGQLAHSVRSAYGEQFDGRAYLDRFVTRYYRLRAAEKASLTQSLVTTYNLQLEKMQFGFPRQTDPTSWRTDILVAYFDAYSLSARQIEKFMSALSTVFHLVQRNDLIGPLILPLIINQILNRENPIEGPPKSLDLLKIKFHSRKRDEMVTFGCHHAFDFMVRYEGLTAESIYKAYHESSDSPLTEWVYETHSAAKRSNCMVADPLRYRVLCNAVGRLTEPKSG